MTLRRRDSAMIFRLASAAAVWVVALSATLLGATFYVAPDAHDGWSGRLEHANADKTDGPFATVIGARNAIRRLKAEGPLAEAVEVIVAAGVYCMDEPLVFEPQDSGTSAASIVYRAAEGAKPILSGGRKITGFRKDDGPLWVAELSEAVNGKGLFRQLFINGRRARRARTPNEGYLHAPGDRENSILPRQYPSARVAFPRASLVQRLISTAEKREYNMQAPKTSQLVSPTIGSSHDRHPSIHRDSVASGRLDRRLSGIVDMHHGR